MRRTNYPLGSSHWLHCISYLSLELREAFAMFDATEQEVIPADQLGNLLRTMGQSPTNKEIEDMLADCSVDTGKIRELSWF